MVSWPSLWPFNEASLVRTTVGSRVEAERLARRLIEERVAACVHITEIASVYRWGGTVQQQTEFLVEARSQGTLEAELRKAMLDGHPYDTPMVESLPASGLPKRYRDWMAGEVR